VTRQQGLSAPRSRLFAVGYHSVRVTAQKKSQCEEWETPFDPEHRRKAGIHLIFDDDIFDTVLVTGIVLCPKCADDREDLPWLQGWVVSANRCRLTGLKI
jgi:hypothetical protein